MQSYSKIKPISTPIIHFPFILNLQVSQVNPSPAKKFLNFFVIRVLGFLKPFSYTKLSVPHYSVGHFDICICNGNGHQLLNNEKHYPIHAVQGVFEIRIVIPRYRYHCVTSTPRYIDILFWYNQFLSVTLNVILRCGRCEMRTQCVLSSTHEYSYFIA